MQRFKIECPNYRIKCDIRTCPRYLSNIRVEVAANGELTGQGFCNERGTRYFGKITGNRITSETPLTITQSKTCKCAHPTHQNNRGRKKTGDKTEMVNTAMSYLKNHPEKSTPQAADYIYTVQESQGKWPNGYLREKKDSFVRAINRARRETEERM